MLTKLKNISVKEIDAHGNAYQNRNGEEQARVSIQIENSAYEGKWLSMFCTPGDFVTQWQRGEEVDISITEKGDFINFKPSKPASKAMADSFRAKAIEVGGGEIGSPVKNSTFYPNGLPANEAKVLEMLGWIEDYMKRVEKKIDAILENQTQAPF